LPSSSVGRAPTSMSSSSGRCSCEREGSCRARRRSLVPTEPGDSIHSMLGSRGRDSCLGRCVHIVHIVELVHDCIRRSREHFCMSSCVRTVRAHPSYVPAARVHWSLASGCSRSQRPEDHHQ
jgi:hypothetical protein